VLFRSHLPQRPPNPGAMPITSIESLGSFFNNILNTSKDWQDQLQSRLQGYAERIVTIRLNPNAEGGLNLNMDDEVIAKLRNLGTEAGRQLTSEFDPDKHRFNRVITALSQVELLVADLAETYTEPDRNGGPDWDDLVNTYAPEKFSKAWRNSPLQTFTKSIIAAGRKAGVLRENGEAISNHDRLSVIDANLRITASADRVPQNRRDT